MREKQMELRGRIQEMPCVIILFAAVNIIVFLLTDFMGDTQSAVFIERCGGMFPPRIYGEGQYWRLLTSCFLHYGADHLTNNMVLLCCIGSRVERLTGHWKTLAIYLLSGLCGSLLSCFTMVYRGEYAVSAGASGAVFGLIGSLLWVVIKNRGNVDGITTKGMVLMVALSLYYGFATIGVDNAGHIGGIVTGFLVTILLYRRRPRNVECQV